MKKISLIIVFFIVFLSLNPVLTQASDLTINDFNSEINYQLNDRTRLSMSWTTSEPMISLEIRIYLENGSIQAPFKWSRDEGKSNSNCIWYNDTIAQPDGKYHYFLEFYIESTQKGTIYLDWQYKFEGASYAHPIYIATGNPNVKDEDYSTLAALLIGFYTTIGASLGTYFIIKISQKSTIIDKENEDELS